MNKQNIKIAIRRIAKNYKLTLLIFVGLVIGLTSSLVIYIKTTHELSFDSFHTQSKNIYRVVRVTSGLDYLGGGFEYRAGVYFPLPWEIRKTIPEIQNIVSMFYLNGQKLSVPAKDSNKEKIFNLESGVVFTEPSFFEIFDFGKMGVKWLKGEGKQVLGKPLMAVITKETADKLFPDQDAMGQEFTIWGTRFTIGGVINDLPQNTDFPFKVFLSMVTFSEKISPESFVNWDSLSDIFQCYVVLNKDSKVATIEQKLKALHAQHRNDELVERRLFKLQPLKEVHKDSDFGNFNYHTVSTGLLLAISLVGAFIFLIAIFNYSNFFLAETFKQKKQIALKLILGSMPRSIFIQFFTESMLLTFFALIVSILFVFAILKYFYIFIDVPFGYTPEIGLSALVFLLLLLFAGGFLAVIFSFFNLDLKSLSSLLKKSNSGYSGRENVFGKWSVILQFIVAQAVIIATLMIVKQIYFINHKELGYDSKNIVIVGLPNNTPSKLSALSGELLSSSAIKGVSFSSVIPAQTNSFSNFSAFINNEKISIDAEIKSIDASYLKVYAFKLLAGENLATNDSAFNIVTNREFITEMGYKNVNDAIGVHIQGIGKDGANIKGIVEDFYSGSMHDKIRPCVFINNPKGFSIMSVRLAHDAELTKGKSAVLPGDINQIKNSWGKIFPDQEFEYMFLSDRIDSYYKSEYKAMNLFLLFAFVTVFLCMLGILGLSLSMNERRIKEIGVRKVNGATIWNLLTMLNKDFVKWVAIAFILATPIAWYAMHRWLENFAYKTNLSWWIFALAGLLALAIALLTVSWQSWRAATRNPVEALRYE